MKKIILLFSLITAMPVMAEDKLCEEIANTASIIMKQRQNGVDISQMLKIANSLNETSKKIFTEMIIEAFEQPQYSGIKYKNEETKRFKEKYYISCLKSRQ